MKGQDCQGRNFVTVKLLVDGNPIFEVFFQRYDRNTYPGLGLWESQRKIIDHSIKKTQWDFIESIINGEEVCVQIIQVTIQLELEMNLLE